MRLNKPSHNYKDFDQRLLSYKSKETSKMDQEEIEQCSTLFSENYGIWSEYGPKPGERIKFTPKMIKESFVDKPNRSVAMVFYENELVGYAFYLRRTVPQKGYLTWIFILSANA